MAWKTSTVLLALAVVGQAARVTSKTTTERPAAAGDEGGMGWQVPPATKDTSKKQDQPEASGGDYGFNVTQESVEPPIDSSVFKEYNSTMTFGPPARIFSDRIARHDIVDLETVAEELLRQLTSDSWAVWIKKWLYELMDIFMMIMYAIIHSVERFFGMNVDHFGDLKIRKRRSPARSSAGDWDPSDNIVRMLQKMKYTEH